MIEERGYFGRPHFSRVAFTVVQDETFYPVNVGLLGAQAEMFRRIVSRTWPSSRGGLAGGAARAG